MKKIFIAIISLIIIVGLFILMQNSSSYVYIVYRKWQLETTLWAMLLCIILFYLFLILVIKILAMPRCLARFYRTHTYNKKLQKIQKLTSSISNNVFSKDDKIQLKELLYDLLVCVENDKYGLYLIYQSCLQLKEHDILYEIGNKLYRNKIITKELLHVVHNKYYAKQITQSYKDDEQQLQKLWQQLSAKHKYSVAVMSAYLYGLAHFELLNNELLNKLIFKSLKYKWSDRLVILYTHFSQEPYTNQYNNLRNIANKNHSDILYFALGYLALQANLLIEADKYLSKISTTSDYYAVSHLLLMKINLINNKYDFTYKIINDIYNNLIEQQFFLS